MKNLSIIAGKSRSVDLFISELKMAGYHRIKVCNTYTETINHLSKGPCDLVLFLIERNNSQIIKVADFLNKKKTVPYIFCIKNQKCKLAIEAAEYNPFEITYEPFNKGQLSEIIEITFTNNENMIHQSINATTVSEVNSQESVAANSSGLNKNNYAFFKSGIEIIKVYFSEIIFVQSDHVYIFLITTGKKIPLRAKLEDIEKYLPTIIFQRIHQRYIVNIDHITRMNSDAVFLDNIELPLSKKYKKTLLKHMNVFT